MLKRLNNENFESEILNSEGISLVDFYADWCAPCKMLSPIIDEIANEYTEINVGKVNIDESSALAAKYNIISVPTLLLFKDGQPYGRMSGYRPKKDIMDIVLS